MYETATLRPPRQQKLELEAESNLFRCMSDASLVKRRRGGRGKSQAQQEKERQHRFSINGHFYNYKASPFLPTHLSLRVLPPTALLTFRGHGQQHPVFLQHLCSTSVKLCSHPVLLLFVLVYCSCTTSVLLLWYCYCTSVALLLL